METNEMQLKEKLAHIQSELKAPKDLKNDFGGFSYRNAEQIEKVAKAICLKYRTTLIVDDKPIQIGERYYVESTATLMDWDHAEVMTAKASAREQENVKGQVEAMITGSCSSYARKYALQGLFLIDDSKDDPDSMDTRDEGTKTPATKEQIEFLTANSSKLIEEFKQMKIKSSKDLSKLSIESASKLIEICQSKTND